MVKIECFIVEGYLFVELEVYKYIYKIVGKYFNFVNVYGMVVVLYGNCKEEVLLMDEVDGWCCFDILRSFVDSWK